MDLSSGERRTWKNLGSMCFIFEPFGAGVDLTKFFLTSVRSFARPFLSPSERPEI